MALSSPHKENVRLSYGTKHCTITLSHATISMPCRIIGMSVCFGFNNMPNKVVIPVFHEQGQYQGVGAQRMLYHEKKMNSAEGS